MNRKGSGMIVGVLVVIVVIGVVVFLGSKVMRTIPTTNETAPTPSTSRGDIDRSGMVDESDRMLVRGQLGCTKTQVCWNKVIGKTRDGDNPIYTSDLDLNKDGAITQADLDLVK
jgi:hypothetical protein